MASLSTTGVSPKSAFTASVSFLAPNAVSGQLAASMRRGVSNPAAAATAIVPAAKDPLRNTLRFMVGITSFKLCRYYRYPVYLKRR